MEPGRYGRMRGTMKKSLLTLFHNFIKCGLTGWCMEIMFTAFQSFRRRDLTLKGTTSIWMFPIYGCAAVLSPISRLLERKPFWVRGITYMSLIFTTEYLTGRILERQRLCPWDYSRCRWNIRRLVRLDFAPCWFGAGLLFERLLSPSSGKSTS